MGIFFSAAGLPWLLERGLAWAWGGSALVGVLGTALGFWAWAGAPRLDDPAPESEIKVARTPIPLDGKKLVAAQAMFSIGLVPHSIYWVDYIVRGLGEPMREGAFQWALVGLGALVGTAFWGRIADRFGLNIGLVAVFVALSASIILPVLIPGAAVIIFSSLVFGSQPGSSAVIASRAQQAMGTASMVPLWRLMVVSVGTAQIIGGIGLVELYNRTGDYRPIFLIGGIAMALAALLCASLSRQRPN
jgi:predicted MFS family arabinose efflux permease